MIKVTTSIKQISLSLLQYQGRRDQGGLEGSKTVSLEIAIPYHYMFCGQLQGKFIILVTKILNSLAGRRVRGHSGA
jgi:hypothetical protein